MITLYELARILHAGADAAEKAFPGGPHATVLRAMADQAGMMAGNEIMRATMRDTARKQDKEG